MGGFLRGGGECFRFDSTSVVSGEGKKEAGEKEKARETRIMKNPHGTYRRLSAVMNGYSVDLAATFFPPLAWQG